MKYLPSIAGALLGLAFLVFGLDHFLHFIPQPKDMKFQPAAGSFMKAIDTTGYLTWVKSMEVLGGLLVAIPKLRNIGLLVLGPVILNILAFHIFLNDSIKDAATIGVVGLISVLALFLLWSERKAWAVLVRRNPA